MVAYYITCTYHAQNLVFENYKKMCHKTFDFISFSRMLTLTKRTCNTLRVNPTEDFL